MSSPYRTTFNSAINGCIGNTIAFLDKCHKVRHRIKNKNHLSEGEIIQYENDRKHCKDKYGIEIVCISISLKHCLTNKWGKLNDNEKRDRILRKY